MLALMRPPLPSERTASVICPRKMERSKRSRTTRMTAIPREALWSAALLRRVSPFRRFAASTLQRFNVSTPQRERASAFTLLELLIVVGIIGLLLVLIAPAFTTIKGGNDVTSAANTIKSVLDTARTYAKANNTYSWVGFYEEDVSRPSVIPAPNPVCPGCVGRLVMSIVASKDGTNVYGSTGSATIDATRLIQVGKLIKIENIHVPLFAF